MFITQKIVDAFNEQIGNELTNYLQYFAIANYFAGQDLSKIASIYYKQGDEERDHAMRFVNFLVDSGASPVIPQLGRVVNDFATAVDAVQLAYDAEVKTTKQIHDLVDLAAKENAPSAQQFLLWFVEEQVEEIATAQKYLNIVKKAGSNLFLMEAYLSHADAD